MIKSCSLNSTTNNSKILQSLRKKTAKILCRHIIARNLRRETAGQISSKIKLNHRTRFVLFNPIDNLYKLRSNISLKTAPPRGNVLAFKKHCSYSKFDNLERCALDLLKQYNVYYDFVCADSSFTWGWELTLLIRGTFLPLWRLEWLDDRLWLWLLAPTGVCTSGWGGVLAPEPLLFVKLGCNCMWYL